MFLTQGLNLSLLHWQAGSLPLVKPLDEYCQNLSRIIVLHVGYESGCYLIFSSALIIILNKYFCERPKKIFLRVWYPFLLISCSPIPFFLIVCIFKFFFTFFAYFSVAYSPFLLICKCSLHIKGRKLCLPSTYCHWSYFFDVLKFITFMRPNPHHSSQLFWSIGGSPPH